MDSRTPFDGLAKHEGKNTPDASRHLCPYLLLGATKEQCLELTLNYQRNLAGCCGTIDSRSFQPCNSVWRKCIKCLSEGKGSRSGSVVDVARGLCQECLDLAKMPVASKHEIVPVRMARRTPTKAADMKSLSTSSAPPVEKRQVPAAAASQQVSDRPTRTVVVEVSHTPSKRPHAEAGRLGIEQPKALKPSMSSDNPPKALETPLEPGANKSIWEELMDDFDLDKAVGRYRALTECNKGHASLLTQGKSLPGFSAISAKATASMLCSKVGVPKSRRRGSLKIRLTVLKRIIERYNALEHMDPKQRAVLEPPKALMVTDPSEVMLLLQVRLLSVEQRDELMVWIMNHRNEAGE